MWCAERDSSYRLKRSGMLKMMQVLALGRCVTCMYKQKYQSVRLASSLLHEIRNSVHTQRLKTPRKLTQLFSAGIVELNHRNSPT